jgi:hypothetical protein
MTIIETPSALMQRDEAAPARGWAMFRLLSRPEQQQGPLPRDRPQPGESAMIKRIITDQI